MTTTKGPRTGDYVLVGIIAAVVVGSLATMLVVVTATPRPLYVMIVEPATWIAATGAVAWMLWRRTIWGRDD
jgi:hypothetical protein